MDEGPIGEKLRSIGIPVNALGMPRGKVQPRALIQLYKSLKTTQPHLVQTWMYHADLLGGIVAWLAGHRQIIWNIRTSTLELGRDKRTTIWTARLCAALSSLIPNKILTCAETAKQVHVRLGYDSSKMEVIANGFNTKRFRASAEARAEVRRELRVGREPLVGIVGRFHPQKDYYTFVQAAAKLRSQVPGVRFVMCGDGVNWENERLVGWIDEYGIREAVSLLGRREDIPRVMAALDLFVLSSASGEAFPNVVGEAMACKVPCVVTDVGDSRIIVGDTGRVVPPKSPGRLASASAEMINAPEHYRQELGERARRRVTNEFSIEAVASKYIQLYDRVINKAYSSK